MAISQKEFFANPEAVLTRGEEVSADWIGQAWREHATLREDVAYYLARSVSKAGNFELADQVWLKVLPGALTAEEAAELYVDILEQSQRLEFEWRPLFLKAFPAAAPLLPEPQDAEILRATLEQQILTGYDAGFDEVVKNLLSLPKGDAALKAPDEAGETLLQMADRLGRGAMADVLREAIARS